jgi:prevent-host-death family protein
MWDLIPGRNWAKAQSDNSQSQDFTYAIWRSEMTKTIKATEAARAFSEIINSVKYKGESYTIIRGGKPVAAIVPIKTATTGRTLKDLRTIMNALPKLGKDSEMFLKDVETGIKSQPPVPETTAWE